MPRMRTAAKVLEIIKEEDPGTEVSLKYIRYLIKSGAVPSVTVGRKKLVDADLVIQHIAAGMTPAMPSRPPEFTQVIPITGGRLRQVAT